MLIACNLINVSVYIHTWLVLPSWTAEPGAAEREQCPVTGAAALKPSSRRGCLQALFSNPTGVCSSDSNSLSTR